MKKIHIYNTKKFIKIFIAVLIAMILFTMIIDFVELSRRFANKEVSFFNIVKLTFLKQPSLIIEILPFIILLTAIIFFTKLSNNYEITVFKSIGTSLYNILLAPIMVIIIIAIIEITIFSDFAKVVNKEYKAQLQQILHPNKSDYHKKNEYLAQEIWFKQDNIKTPYIFKAQYVTIYNKTISFNEVTLFFIKKNNFGKELIDANSDASFKNVIKKNPDFQIESGAELNLKDKGLYNRYMSAELIDANSDASFKNENQDVLYAEKMVLTKQKLYLHNVTIPALQRAISIPEMVLPTNLSTILIINYLKNNNKQINSLWDLLEQRRLLNQAKIKTTKQDALLSLYFLKPLSYILLFLLAALLCIYPPRYQKKLLNIILTIILGFSIYALLNIGYSLAVSEAISIIFGIWITHIFLILVILYLLIRKEL